jgi:hypothetical protein
MAEAARAAAPPDMAAIAQMPEFQKAVAEAAAKAVAEIAKGGAPIAAGVDEQTRQLFSEMALAIANMSHQGDNRKPVAPEIIAKREASGRKCMELLNHAIEQAKKAQARGVADEENVWIPRYKLIAKTYIGEKLHEPWQRGNGKGSPPVQTEILFSGIPNEAMKPANAVAEDIYDAYRDSIGASPRLKAISGPNGGQVAQDNRPAWVTPNGHVVIGAAPARAFVGPILGADVVPSDVNNNDPTAPLIRVLGTVAAPARQNFAERR